MSHISKIFEEAPIQVQNRNGFDLSHVHSGTSKCGQLVPVLTKLLAPNSTISLGVQAEVSLPPLVAPFYGKVDFEIDGFIVPCSILYGGWKNFITNNDPSNFPSNQNILIPDANNPTVITDGQGIENFGKTGYAIPYFPLTSVARYDTASFRTLSTTNDNIYNYMGLNFSQYPVSTGSTDININMLPGLAYHKICDVFYRNTKITKTWFGVNPNVGFPGNASLTLSATEQYASSLNQKNVSLVWHSFYTQSTVGANGGLAGNDTVANFDTAAQLIFPDTTSFFSTRQRPYARDYFTSAVASPQQGGSSVLKFAVNVATPGSETGSFTIQGLRAANSLQKFLETNNLSGEYADMMRNRWGVRPIDADFDEPHYLGRVVVPVYKHSIYQSVNGDSQDTPATGNYFTNQGILGSKAASAGTEAEGSICDNFNVSCWSYLMCIASLVPHANYNYGLSRELTMTKLGDYPAPELQSVGMEEIKNYELWLDGTSGVSTLTSTFGYIPRYSRFKYMDDHCSGELKPVSTLSQFQLSRRFTSLPALGTNFLTIGQSDLDSVLAVNTSTMKLTCWWEIYFKLHVVMPLADFCIPTLGDIRDTHTVKTTVGGSRL